MENILYTNIKTIMKEKKQTFMLIVSNLIIRGKKCNMAEGKANKQDLR